LVDVHSKYRYRHCRDLLEELLISVSRIIVRSKDPIIDANRICSPGGGGGINSQQERVLGDIGMMWRTKDNKSHFSDEVR